MKEREIEMLGERKEGGGGGGEDFIFNCQTKIVSLTFVCISIQTGI